MLHTAAVATQPISFIPARAKAAMPGAKTAVACASCCLQGVCLPSSLSGQDLERFGAVVTTRRRIHARASLYREGDRFESLYAVRSGAFKTISVSRHGAEKVTGFHLAGELVGLEGIESGEHRYTAVALEDSEVCALQFAALEKLSAAVPTLQRQLFRALSSDISRDQGLMLLLGSMSAEQRLAAFLLSISRRYQRLGFAANSFVLRMTRAEIGSYLGLTLETVSRLFSRFQREGLIGVNQREVELYDTRTLREIVG